MGCGRRRAHPERGQGTVEYVAVVAIVALVLGAAVAGAAAFGPGIGGAVVAQVRHALCVVTGTACAQPAPRACLEHAVRDRIREGGEARLLRLGADRVVLRETFSDGTQRLTVVDGADAALVQSLAPRTRVKVGDVDVDVGAHAQVTIGALLGSGRVYEVHGEAEAKDVLQRLGAHGSPVVGAVKRAWDGIRGKHAVAPRPVASFVQGGILGSLDGGVAREGIAEAGASTTGEQVLGRRVDHRTGETTWYLRLRQDASVFASALLGSASAVADGDALLAVTTDRSGRATELSALVGGRVQAGAATAGALAGLGAASAGGTRWEGEARVDVSDPQVRAALDAWRSAPASSGRVRDLAHALADRATLDVRSYARDAQDDETGFAVSGVGIERSTSHEETRLLAARTRAPGGLWSTREDCPPVPA